MEFRRAYLDDLDRVVELWVECSEHHSRHHTSWRVTRHSQNLYRANLERALASPQAVLQVAEWDGVIVAYCHASVRLNPPERLERRVGVVESIWVETQSRGRGIESELLATTIAQLEAAGVERVEAVLAAPEGEDANFWQQAGFQPLAQVLSRGVQA